MCEVTDLSRRRSPVVSTKQACRFGGIGTFRSVPSCSAEIEERSKRRESLSCFWSKASARLAMGSGRSGVRAGPKELLPVRLDSSEPPARVRGQIQALDLTGWSSRLARIRRSWI